MLEVKRHFFTHNIGRFKILPAEPRFIVGIGGQPCRVCLRKGILPWVLFKPESHPCPPSVGLAVAVHLVKAIENT